MQIIENSGTFAHPFQLIGFISTKNEMLRTDIEILFQFMPPNAIDLGIIMDVILHKQEIRRTLIEVNRFHFIGVVTAILLHPKSHGSIELKKNDPYEHPFIYPNFLSHPDDMETLLHAIKDQISYIDTKAYQFLDLQLIKIFINECDKYEYGSDDYWRCYIRHMSQTI